MAQKQAYQADPKDYKLEPKKPCVGETRTSDEEKDSKGKYGPKGSLWWPNDKDYMDKAVKDTSSILQKSGQRSMESKASRESGRKIPGYKRGGSVRKTGPALLHKGERVLTKAQTKRYRGKP